VQTAVERHIPEDNKSTPDPKVIKHVHGTRVLQRGHRRSPPGDLIRMSEAVYNFQRIFNLRMGFGRARTTACRIAPWGR